MSVSRRLRYEVMRRDRSTCTYCGAQAPGVELTIDHVIPVALGGSDDPTNLVTACKDCNAGKSSVAPDSETVEAASLDATRWSKAVEQAAKARRGTRGRVTKAVRAFETVWTERFGSMPSRHRLSIDNFIAGGLNADDIAHFARKAIDRGSSFEHCWLYFCKVCWSEITEIQQAAAEAVGAVPVEQPAEEPEPAEPETELQELYRAFFGDQPAEPPFAPQRTGPEDKRYEEAFARYEREQRQLERDEQAQPKCRLCGARCYEDTAPFCLDCREYEGVG